MSEKPDHPDYRSRDYPVREDMAYQVKVWRFERGGWYVLVLIILLALGGLFSRGPVSSREAHGSDGKVRVQYEMFHRNGSSNPMKITVIGLANATVELELAGELLDGFSIESLLPEPIRASSAGEGMTLWLPTDFQGRASVYLTLQGEGVGLFRTRIASPGAEPVNLDQFIFP